MREVVVGRVGGEVLTEIGVGGCQVMVGEHGKQVVQSVVADGKGEEEPCEEVSLDEVTGVQNVVFQFHLIAVAVLMMIGQ